MSDLFGAYVIQASHVFLRTQEPKVRSAALVTLGSCVRRSTRGGEGVSSNDPRSNLLGAHKEKPPPGASRTAAVHVVA